MITVHDEPGILSQTHRRRRYPDHQQRARYNNLQQAHVAEKYSLICVISTQMFTAPITAKLPIIRRIHGFTLMGKVASSFPFGPS